MQVKKAKYSPFVVLGLLLFVHLQSATAQGVSRAKNAEDTVYVPLLHMSLEEMMNIAVKTGTLSGIKKQNIPVSITTITSEDIKTSPARNLLDLLETYVPGALYMNHIEGPHHGVRGIIADRSYKVLLLVNGKNLNQKVRNGASTELENWDMNDIDRVEVIRGPGSVIYGPGAIMGVINIITKNASTAPGVQVNSQYVSQYRSAGTSLSYGTTNQHVGFYGYASITRTPGFAPDAYAVDVAAKESGYVGKDFSSKSVRSNPVQRYFSDYHDEPQVKVYMELNFLKEWTLWTRYTNSGATMNGTFYQSRPQLGFSVDSLRTNPDGSNTYYRSPIYGEYQDFLSISNKQFSALLQNKHEFSFLGLPELLEVQASIGYYNLSGAKGITAFAEYPFDTPSQQKAAYADINNEVNRNYSFSEREWLGNVLINVPFHKKHKIAFGTEYSVNTFGPSWDTKVLKLQNFNPFLTSGQSPLTINKPWSTTTYSFFSEYNLNISPYLTVLASGRSDKNSYAKWMFSPRLALVSELDEKNVIKAVIQRSQRINNAEELKFQHQAKTLSDPETLKGIELIYSRIQGRNLLFNFATFYNQIGVLSWSGKDNTTRLTGDLKLAGVEAELRYTLDNATLGINHAFTKQLSWKMADGITVNGISYSDYNQSFPDGTVFKGHGNDLNNWANHATKLFGRVSMMNKRITLHGDCRSFWGFQGAKDGLTMIEKSITGDESKSHILDLIADVREKDAYGIDFRFNGSATYKINNSLSISAFAINLFKLGDAKRYSYDAGITVQGPARVGFVEEPTTFGGRLKISL